MAAARISRLPMAVPHLFIVDHVHYRARYAKTLHALSDTSHSLNMSSYMLISDERARDQVSIHSSIYGRNIMPDATCRA